LDYSINGHDSNDDEEIEDYGGELPSGTAGNYDN